MGENRRIKTKHLSFMEEEACQPDILIRPIQWCELHSAAISISYVACYLSYIRRCLIFSHVQERIGDRMLSTLLHNAWARCVNWTFLPDLADGMHDQHSPMQQLPSGHYDMS